MVVVHITGGGVSKLARNMLSTMYHTSLMWNLWSSTQGKDNVTAQE